MSCVTSNVRKHVTITTTRDRLPAHEEELPDEPSCQETLDGSNDPEIPESCDPPVERLCFRFPGVVSLLRDGETVKSFPLDSVLWNMIAYGEYGSW